MMKSRILALPLLASIVLITTSSGGGSTPAWEQENVSFPMMNLEIRNAMNENDRQVQMRNKQVTNTALETNNKEEWSKFRQMTVKIQDRLKIVSFAIQSVTTGVAISREIESIKHYQTLINEAIQSAPYSVVVALPGEIDFLNKLQMNVRLVAGIVLSYGAINQMEKAERKILLDFALGEIRDLRRDSQHTLFKVNDLIRKVQWKKNTIKGYVNLDKQIIGEILNNIKGY
ncbi:hypothetical protein SAMN05660493_01549 [Epilithonimonas bovis DSM 19482]|uniref:Uncharacterized protein n=1 Tax=Epilithonimonas bovis DSM 19482 TaxID=1121284 RepID=A0A1U7PWH7_9FLAO|nr:hypothetical protein [Epilithonimonas bovis]SIT96854.1 hypothetical protein SAMN05660493_01549 [Epilithonimonas bovis DSM 19482]